MSMMPHSTTQPLPIGFPHQFPHHHPTLITHPFPALPTFSLSQPIPNLQGVVITELPSIPSHHSIYERILPQISIPHINPIIDQENPSIRASQRPASHVIQANTQSLNHIEDNKTEREPKSTGLFDIEKEELKEEVKRLQGLLKKNEGEIESMRRELANKNQVLVELERRVSSEESSKVLAGSQIGELEQENLKLKSIIEKLNIDRESIVKTHEKYLKGDQQARIEIFGEVQKLQKLVQQKTKDLQESKQREIIISKQFEGYKNQIGNQMNQGERNTVHLMEKLKVALEGKELQIESLNQAIQNLDDNLSASQKANSQGVSRIKSLETYILEIEAQNANLKDYQNHRQHQISFQSNNQLSILRSQVIELQRHLELYRDKEAMSTYAGISQKDQEVKLKVALQDAESNQITMQYLSKEIHNYRLIVQDLESYKENGYKKDIQIMRLHQSIGVKEKELVELEGVNEELRGKVRSVERSEVLSQERAEEVIRRLEEKCVGLNGRVEVLEGEKVGRGQVELSHADIHVQELAKALDLSRNQYFNLRKSCDQKIFQLQTVSTDLQNQLRLITTSVNQKEAERVFFQQQYRTLYGELLEVKRHSREDSNGLDEIKDLKERLFHSEQENNQLEAKLMRVLEGEKEQGGRLTFNSGGLSSTRGVQSKQDNTNQRKYQQHHRQTQSMAGLREENDHLKLLLEDAQNEIEEYVSNLDECQSRMGLFQDRMESLLVGGSGRQAGNHHQYVNQRRQVIEQVQQLKVKLKTFKKENQKLKRKVRETKEEYKRVKKESKSLRKDREENGGEEKRQKVLEDNTERVKENRILEKRIEEMTIEIEERNGKIHELTGFNHQLRSKVAQSQQVISQNQSVLKEYQLKITQYQKAINRYQARIKQYQNHMLKMKNKYKQQASLRFPQPEIERPINPVHNTSERLEFFRVKSLEAEQRVIHLLKINNELKIQLDQTSELIGGENIQTHKIQLLEGNIENLEKKLLGFAQENIELKARMETVDDNPNLSAILEVKMRQLMEENSELRVQISQSHSEIFGLKQQVQKEQVPSHDQGLDIERFKYLEEKFEGLNQVIYSLESEKVELQNENNHLKLSLGKENVIQSENILLQQISDLQQELYQLKAAKRGLEVELQQLQDATSSLSKPQETTISMETYTILIVQVDKLFRLSDTLHTIFGNVVDVIVRTESEELKEAVDLHIMQAGEIFKGIEDTKYALEGLRQQSEQAIMIHEMNQII